MTSTFCRKMIIGKSKTKIFSIINSSLRQSYGFDINATSTSVQPNSRSCLITLILALIIISLLTIVSLIIAIYTLASNTNKTITIQNTYAAATESTSTTDANSAPICTAFPVTSYQYSSTAPFQCSNYTNNSDATRNIVYTQSINYCDNTSPFNNQTSVWIRFLDPAGKVLINAPESPNRCGTVATGWYAGQYPAAAFTTASSIVCFFDSSNTCSACRSISITNCQTFFVFLLPQPNACNYRYCTI